MPNRSPRRPDVLPMEPQPFDTAITPGLDGGQRDGLHRHWYEEQARACTLCPSRVCNLLSIGHGIAFCFVRVAAGAADTNPAGYRIPEEEIDEPRGPRGIIVSATASGQAGSPRSRR